MSGQTPEYIKSLYNNFVKPISQQNNIKIETLLETIYINKSVKYETCLPITPAHRLKIGSIMMGIDNFAYVVKENSIGKYWHKIPRL